MQTKPFQEIGSFQQSDYQLIVLMIISPGECDLFVIDLQDAVIRDGYPVGISSQV